MTFIDKQASRLIDLHACTHLSSARSPEASRDGSGPVRLDHFTTRYEPEDRIFWSMVQLHDGPARVTEGLLRDVLRIQAMVGHLREAQAYAAEETVRYFVSGSTIPGVYNLGGDLTLFAASIRTGDRAALRAYAHLCIDVVHANHVAFDLPIVTIGLVQGDALGGGFENALSYDVLVAERSAKLGLPEILFNLFPGMGAYSFLSRRLDPARAEQIIQSGRVYTGAELHAMGVVDVLAEDGQGEHAVRDYIRRNGRKFNAQHALLRTRRRVNPITEQELRDVVEIWVDAAMQLEDADLRKMERLVAAQRRRFAGHAVTHLAAAE